MYVSIPINSSCKGRLGTSGIVVVMVGLAFGIEWVYRQPTQRSITVHQSTQNRDVSRSPVE